MDLCTEINLVCGRVNVRQGCFVSRFCVLLLLLLSLPSINADRRRSGPTPPPPSDGGRLHDKPGKSPPTPVGGPPHHP
ncbi:hypothetical protein O6P43_012967 [Quillaja saponaria]|nr:hypothetical protein O6P43_012967 [Quillaja saponaria]